MGLESHNDFNVNFMNKYINNLNNSNELNNEEDLDNNDRLNGDELNDINKLESKVDIYLSKIKELDSELYENKDKYDIINEKIKEFVSIEKLHRTGSNNRHIYFAGIPLSYSLEVLNNLKTINSQKDQITKLESEIEGLNSEITQLNEDKLLCFYKFEQSIKRALSLGQAVQLLIGFVNDYENNGLRVFFNKLRSVNYDYMRMKLRKLNNYKVYTLSNIANRHVKSRLSQYFKMLYSYTVSSNSNFGGSNGYNSNTGTRNHENNIERSNDLLKKLNLNFDENFKSKLVNKEFNKDNQENSDMETNLLNRLEKLLMEEMNMLNK